MVAVDTAWLVGWVLGGVVVVVAAVLLVAIIALARRVAAQADGITRALEGAREHTEPLFEVRRTNLAIDRITRGLAAVRKGDGQ